MEMYYGNEGVNRCLNVELGMTDRLHSDGYYYHVRMLENNRIRHLLCPCTISTDGRLALRYETDSYYVLSRMLQSVRLDGELFLRILTQIGECVEALTQYLLTPNHLVLNPEYMYYNCDTLELKLVYAPGYCRDLREQLRQLFEYMMRVFAPGDKRGIQELYSLYSLLDEETPDVAALLRKVSREGGQERRYSAEDTGGQRGRYSAEDADGHWGRYSAEDTGGQRGRYSAEDTDGQRGRYSAEDTGGQRGRYSAGDADGQWGRYSAGDADGQRVSCSAGQTDGQREGQFAEMSDVRNDVRRNIRLSPGVLFLLAVESGTAVFSLIKVIFSDSRLLWAYLLIGSIALMAVVCVCCFTGRHEDDDAAMAEYSFAAPDIYCAGMDASSEVYPEISEPDTIRALVPLSDGALREIDFACYGDKIIIGRGKNETDYRLSATEISRIHACIYKKEEGIYIEDRNSTNGTYLNSVRIPSNEITKLNRGDILGFANEEFFVS